MRALLAVIAIGCSGSSPAPIVNAPPAPAAPLVLGLEERTALADAVLLPDGVLARTTGGALVRFDDGLAVVADARPASPITAIARAGDHSYGGRADGTIGKLDRKDLTFDAFLKISGTPLWLGSARPGELLAFMQVGEAHAYRLDVITLESRRIRSIPLPPDRSEAGEVGRPSRFLAEGDHVWFGIDAGEWGGSVGKIDLRTGTVTMLSGVDGVYGLLAHRGRVFAYGGTTHMGFTNGYISELTSGRPVPAWSRSGDFDRKPVNPRALPVAAMAADRDGFVVLVWNELYAVDATFAKWTKLAAIRARETHGRPDSVGNYPATIAMFTGAHGERVLATAHDGLFVLRGTEIVPAK